MCELEKELDPPELKDLYSNARTEVPACEKMTKAQKKKDQKMRKKKAGRRNEKRKSVRRS